MDLFQQQIKKTAKLAPLADRMRPKNLEEFVGQEKIMGKGKPLRIAIEQDQLQSIILWGPPGSGKTTLATIIAHATSSFFVRFSAITSGIPDLKEIIKEVKQRWTFQGQRTILFVDEIHRFNKTIYIHLAIIEVEEMIIRIYQLRLFCSRLFLIVIFD